MIIVLMLFIGAYVVMAMITACAFYACLPWDNRDGADGLLSAYIGILWPVSVPLLALSAFVRAVVR